MKWQFFLPTVVAVAFGQGCSVYKAAPLPFSPAFPASVDQARYDVGTNLPLELSVRPFDARDGLDITEAATLAVVNNPDLQAARLALRVSTAQSFAAGLLPDPQINLSRDFPVVTGPGISTAFLLGVGYSINVLLSHSTVLEAGSADDRQAALNLAWQEWQVIAQTRMLFVRLSAAKARRALLIQARQVLEDRYARTRAALKAGLLPLDSVTPHLVALQDVQRQVSDLERQTNQASFDLLALLGLAPDTVLLLQGDPDLPMIDANGIDERLPALLAARPDVQALRAGYGAQDARYRVALLSQFPTLTIGVQRARDTSNAYTRGFAVNLTLPIFNGGRGEIHLQDTTRDKLRAEYQQRLNAGTNDVHRVLAEQGISRQQLSDIERALVALRSARDRMRAALSARNIDALSLATLETATVAKESERIDTLQAIQEQRVALLTLIGQPGFSAISPIAPGSIARTS